MRQDKNIPTNTSTIEEIENELQNAMFIDDKNLKKEIEKEKSEGDNIHIKLLKDISESHSANHKQKKGLKSCFFWIVMSMYIIVILGSIAAMILIPIFCSNLIIAVPSVLGSIVSMVTTILKIPSIIAEYLFPKDEDDLLLKLSSNVFKHDEKLKQTEKIER